MDIFVNVINQKMCIASTLDNVVSGSQNFVKFRFNLSHNWEGLFPVVQFAQAGRDPVFVILDSDNCAYLPNSIQPGTCTMTLYGTSRVDREDPDGGITESVIIGTTNYITLRVDKNIFVESSESTDIPPSLYSQLVAMVESALSIIADSVETHNDLLNYDTSGLKNNDVVIVLTDSTHDDQKSYYKWIIRDGLGSWVYIGESIELYSSTQIDQLLLGKVDKVDGKGLSTNDFTNAEKNKLLGIETGAEANKVNDIRINGESVVSDKIANLEIKDNVTSTDSNKALSANMGKSLQDQINNLKARGRFLSLWNATTGLAMSEPSVNPYEYKTGDYFIVEVVGTTNYKPSGASYDKDVPSTAIETSVLVLGDSYFYDGTTWILQKNTQIEVSFNSITGSPFDNTALGEALNNKVDKVLGKGLSTEDFTTEEKEKLEAMNVFYGSCISSTREVNKVVTVDNSFSLAEGVIISVMFLNSCIGDHANQNYLNVNNTGAKPIAQGIHDSDFVDIPGGTIQFFVYSNNKWVQTDFHYASGVDFGSVKLSDSTNSENDENNHFAATPKAVKTVADIANAKQDPIADLATIRSGAALGATAIQPSDLAVEVAAREDGDTTLQDQINNLKARGRFLSLWNATTGLAMSEPSVNPYEYRTGDYFIVEVVDTTNYKPSGTQYDKDTPSTAVETNALAQGDSYFFDGTTWILQKNTQMEISFSSIAGSPFDNTALASVLNGKLNKNQGTENVGKAMIVGSDGNLTPSEIASPLPLSVVDGKLCITFEEV